MHILISSETPIDKSGYGVQTLNMIKMFSKMGHNITVIGWNLIGFDIKKYTFGEIVLLHDFDIAGNFTSEELALMKQVGYYPALHKKFPVMFNPKNIFEQIIRTEKIDVIIFHQDIFVLQLKQKLSKPTICCLPVHHDPIDYLSQKVLKFIDINVGLCDFGVKKLKEISKNYCVKIPLTINTDIMKYTGKTHNEQYNLPKDKFICLIVSDNYSKSNRKAFDLQILAFKKLHEKYPETYLYMHTQKKGGVNLLEYLKELPESSYGFVDQEKHKQAGFSITDMANIYKSCNVLLNASKAEGFGIPIIEAQSCGCSVLTNNFSSMKELTVNGICCEQKKLIKSKSAKSFWSCPNVDKMAEALIKMYEWTKEEKIINKLNGIKYTKNFTEQNIYEKWENLLNLNKVKRQ